MGKTVMLANEEGERVAKEESEEVVLGEGCTVALRVQGAVAVRRRETVLAAEAVGEAPMLNEVLPLRVSETLPQ